MPAPRLTITRLGGPLVGRGAFHWACRSAWAIRTCAQRTARRQRAQGRAFAAAALGVLAPTRDIREWLAQCRFASRLRTCRCAVPSPRAPQRQRIPYQA